MSKKNDLLSDSDITRLLGVPRSTIQDWKKSPNDTWRKKLYIFLKSHSYSELALRVDMIKPFLSNSLESD
ncbi:helix-turn-helix domain-containing protein [Sulfurimonas sp. NWX367]|uniref:helix-turn-helix domain-containing protein n=1 Tax=Sulfurimonas sp. NWX367 TaxID=2925413 RepID=UPI003204F4AD